MIKVNGLTHRFDARKTDGITNLNFDVLKGEVLSLIGPSGSGKTTTLKCLAGIISEFQGVIEISKEEKVAYIDQTPNLDLEQTVFENLNESAHSIVDEQQRENQIRMTLSQLDLTNEIHSLVKNLSGGQRQRVTLAKSIVLNPSILLLDEPFANLDKTLRLNIVNDLLPMMKDQNITLIWVTHNQEEALRYSDRIILMNHGEIEQIGPPRDIYLRPGSLFAANFFGETNVLASTPTSLDEKEFTFKFHGISYIAKVPEHFKLTKETDLLICVRPEFVKLTKTENTEIELVEQYFLGESNLLKLKTQNGTLWSKMGLKTELKVGDFVEIKITAQDFHFLGEV